MLLYELSFEDVSSESEDSGTWIYSGKRLRAGRRAIAGKYSRSRYLVILIPAPSRPIITPCLRMIPPRAFLSMASKHSSVHSHWQYIR